MNGPWDEARYDRLRAADRTFSNWCTAALILIVLFAACFWFSGCEERPQLDVGEARYEALDGLDWAYAELRALGVEGARLPWPPDAVYVVPSVESAREVLAVWQWELANEDDLAYELNTWDCNAIADDFKSAFKRVHRRANPGIGAAIPIASVAVRGVTEVWAGVTARNHALNLAILRNAAGSPGWYVIEPQADPDAPETIRPLGHYPNLHAISWEELRP